MTMHTQLPMLSKSRYCYGLQCHKRLYLECFDRDVMGEPDAGLQARFDMGHEVGELAQQRFAGGVLVAENHFEHATAVKKTAKLMADPKVKAIYEAAFVFDDIRVRVDVLVRKKNRWDIVEVKSTTTVKEQHLDDLAIQWFVVDGAGVALGKAYLMHLDNGYVYNGRAYDLKKLFALEELTHEVLGMQPEIPAALVAMRAALRAPSEPDIPMGAHCNEPYDCPFLDYCGKDLATVDFPLEHLPRISQKQRTLFAEEGIVDVREIDEGLADELGPLQRRVWEVVRSGTPFYSPKLAKAFAGLNYPLHFLDFETFSPVIPLYKETRPYEAIPFQWSDHVLGRAGDLQELTFLHDGKSDPRKAFVESLLEALGTQGSIVVYSGYEKRILNALAAALPKYAARIEAVVARLFDLLPAVRDHVYHPAFGGSFSIKAVLPALVPGLGYDDLDIANGEVAALAYYELTRPETTARRRNEITAHLLAYCGRDTLAMMRLYETLAG